ncbi:FtsK/SpoIIIE domain-containing protein [Lacisediminihabitans sp. FW035]
MPDPAPSIPGGAPSPIASATPPGDTHPIAAPRPPEESRPNGFPVIAVLAPVIGSVLIWALTRSPFALVFALLGPLVAIASVADARIQSRRTARRESARFDREVAATRATIDRLHTEERGNRLRTGPGAVGLTARPTHDPERWRSAASGGVPVRLGLGRASSAVTLDGRSAPPPVGEDPVQRTLDELSATAWQIDGVPIMVDARLGLGVCGPAPIARAVARGILLQLADSLSPACTTFSPCDPVSGGWISTLPQRSTGPVDGAPATGASTLGWRSAGESGVVAVAAQVEDLPVECRVVVRVSSGRTGHLIRCPDDAGLGSLPMTLEVELVSAEQADELGRFLATSADLLGVAPEDADAEAEPSFHGLRPPSIAAGSRGSLACVFARAVDDGDGMIVDLVAHGPHAVIGGTTGSGKSELLVSWVLAMALAHSPAAVNFLLVDFKGGSAFAPIRSLRHVVGVVTDLDERTAHRAMLSLRAELRYRERVIADAGARSVDDPGVELPRLVIVVDEFAALAGDYPQLHELFADLAARGRSLGLHLVLCTQRPAGAIRDTVLANATLRLSLRVNNRADSLAVLGTSQAAELRGDRPGRALVSLDGGAARLVRVARVTEADVRRVGDQTPTSGPAIRRPWCDDLGTSIPLSALDRTGDGIPFGLVDLPEEQRQETALWQPARAGNLLVIGAQGSGKSGLFDTLGCATGVEVLPAGTDEAWDAVEEALGRVRAGVAGARVLLADDLDALVGRFAEEYQREFVDRLVELARGGSAVGLQLGISVRRVPPALQTLAALCDERIILRLGSRQDHLMAGGTTAGFSADAPPGAGEWRGSRIQVALRATFPAAAPGALATPAPPIGRHAAPAVAFGQGDHRTVAVVTTRVAEFTRRLRAIDPPVGEVRALATGARAGADPIDIVDASSPTVIVGDPDCWQANWAMLGAVRTSGLIVIDRCSVAEFRAISGRRSLPPPIRAGVDHCWAMDPDGSVRRMQAPLA